MRIERGGEKRRFEAEVEGSGQRVTIIEYAQFQVWADSSDPNGFSRAPYRSYFQTTVGMEAKQVAQSDEYTIRGLGNIVVKEIPGTSSRPSE